MSIRGAVLEILKQNPEMQRQSAKEATDFLMSFPELRSARRKTVKRSLYMARKQLAMSSNAPSHPGDAWDYDPDAETYTLHTREGTFRDVPASEVQSWVSWYSNQGGKLSQSQVAREAYKHFNRQLSTKQVAALLATLGISKNSPPVAPHLLDEGVNEGTLQKVREAQEAAFEVRLQATEADAWKRRYEELRRLYRGVENLGDKIAASIKPRPDRSFPLLSHDTDLEPQSQILFLCDWHVGQCFDTPFGAYNRAVFRTRLQRLAQECDEWLRSYNRPLEHLHIAIGGDIVDGVLPMRPQHSLDQDLHEGDQVEEASQALSWLIEGVYRRAGVPCTVWSVGGNHDRAGGDRKHDPNRIIFQWLTQVTKARLPRDITWHHCRDTVTTWRIYDTLVLLTHGDRMPKDPKVLVGPYRRPDIKNYLVLTAHKHTIQVQESLDVTWVQGPSLVGYDPYGAHHMGLGSRPSQCLVEVRRDGPRPVLGLPVG
jgi:hypothetical protein